MRTSLTLVLLAVLLTPLTSFAVEPDWVRRWTEDLEEAKRLVADIHPNPYHRTSRERFEGEIDMLAARLDELEQHEIAVELGRIMALLGDGHTRLTWPLGNPTAFVQGHSRTEPPTTPDLVFHDLPIRFGIYEEGVFVERIDARYRELLGAQLVRIGKHSLDEAIELLTPVVRHDNESQLLDLLPMHMVVAEILHARGLSATADRCSFSLATANGVQAVELAPSGPDVDWVSALPDRSTSLSHRHLVPGASPTRGAFDRNYWFDLLPDGKTVFLQYNAVENDEGENILEFSRRLRRFMADGAIERLIIDLRYNWGGDNSLNRSLLHALISSDTIRGPGGVFVLIGRGTFSAAMMFAVDLERHLGPVFVGEPTGSSPNNYGDSRRNRLEHTGLTLRISTLTWQYSNPKDTRDAINPQVPVVISWADRRAGRDPELERLLRASKTTIEGSWSGKIGQRGEPNIPVSARFLASGGSFEIEGLESVLEVKDLEIDGKSVKFRLESPIGELEIDGKLASDLFFGFVSRIDRPDFPLPFAMERPR